MAEGTSLEGGEHVVFRPPMKVLGIGALFVLRFRLVFAWFWFNFL